MYFFASTSNSPDVYRIEFAGGTSWAPTHSTRGMVAVTWIGDVMPVPSDPLLEADPEEVSALLDRHVERLDDVYRRLR